MLSDLVQQLAGMGRRGRPGPLAPSRGPLEYQVLQDQCARVLFQDALAHGGWAGELGVLRPAEFRSEATTLLNAIALGYGQSGPPPP
jgi:hypothetical protein